MLTNEQHFKSKPNKSENENDFDEETYGPSVENNGWIPKLFENNYRTTQLVFTKKNGRTFTCLRQPRDLYTISKSSIQLNIRCPSEAQIYSRRPLHILYTPPKPEPLQKKEKDFSDQLDKSANVFGKVVYDNSPDPEVRYFVSSKVDLKTSSTPTPYYTLKDEKDNTLQFESRFESGNLMRAIKTGEYEYQLWLKFDLYTKKHTQWFYFQIKNAHPNVTYKFTIMNFLKSGSLYNEGMRPLLYSEKDAQEKKIGWIRAGSHIRYYKNDIKLDENRERTYYSLHWRCSFPNDNDTYYLAHSYPYTYSDLQEYLMFLSNDPQRRKCCKQRVLCQTLAGNDIYLLTITTPTRCPKQAKIKRTIVITGRIHPGETIGSWMMKGLLDYLTSTEPDAKILRETFIFKIIPMLNPDGVIVGNYRCSLSGRDLNRNYKTVLKDSFPPVWSTKYLIKKLQEEREIVLYCDFHGHSRKKDIFMYGCENKQEKLSTRLDTRFFPYILSKNVPDKFSFSNCRFRVQKSKEGTGRVVMWNMGIRYAYTLEASFCGSSSTAEGKEEFHYGVQDYEEMGYHFCDGLLDLFDPDTKKLQRILEEIKKGVQSAILRKMITTTGKRTPTEQSQPLEVVGEQYFSDIESESCGSDSSASDGLPMQLLHASISEITKKKRLKSRKERNKSRKQRHKHKTSTPITSANIKQPPATDPTQPPDRIKGKRKTKPAKPLIGSGTQVGRMVYTSRHCENDCQKCSSHHHTDCFDRITNSYVQAGLLDKEPSSYASSGSPPCEKCNPSFYFYDTSDEPLLPHHLSNYSLYDIRMPSYATTELNPTLELARRITAFNYRNGKVPRRMSKMFAIWSNLDAKKDEPSKRNLLSQGDNLEYFTNRLKKVHSTFSPHQKPIKTTPSEKKMVDKLVKQHSQTMNRLHSTRNTTLNNNNDTASSQSARNSNKPDNPFSPQLMYNKNIKCLPKLETLSPRTSSFSSRRLESNLRSTHAHYVASKTTSENMNPHASIIGMKPPLLDETFKERVADVSKTSPEKRLLSQKDIYIESTQESEIDTTTERCKSGRRSVQRGSPDMRAITPQQYCMYPK